MTTNIPIQRLLSELFPVCAMIGFIETIAATLSSVIRAQGRQAVLTRVTIMVFYIFLLPLAVYLAFYQKHGVAGVTWAVFAGYCLNTPALIWLLRGNTFEDAVKKAAHRIETDDHDNVTTVDYKRLKSCENS